MPFLFPYSLSYTEEPPPAPAAPPLLATEVADTFCAGGLLFTSPLPPVLVPVVFGCYLALLLPLLVLEPVYLAAAGDTLV